MFVRRAFYCTSLTQCSWDLDMHFGSVITHPDVVIGPRVYIGAYSLIGKSRLGENVIIGSRVSVLSGRYPHRFQDVTKPIAAQPGQLTPTSIGVDTWCGEGAIIMANVGPRCVVGAGAVVIKEVPESTVVAGNPARSIGRRGDAPRVPSIETPQAHGKE
jgi:acetyltransferase-like isoleucine patch superfamily enzyme